MINDVKEILFDEATLANMVEALGVRITEDYHGEDLLVIGILKGANIFMGDLIRKINLPIQIDFMAVSSYGHSTQSSGVVKINKDLDCEIENRHVLIVEDIVDTGLTLKYLAENLMTRGPKSLKICTLLDKPERRKAQISIDYKGFDIPDVFIVGYGIDYAEKYRNLPFVASLKEEVYA